MQSAPVQLTQMPTRPTCNPSAFSGADCQDRWHLYNQAAHQATAPLQQQIEDLNKLPTCGLRSKNKAMRYRRTPSLNFRLSSTPLMPCAKRGLRLTPKACSKALASAWEPRCSCSVWSSASGD